MIIQCEVPLALFITSKAADLHLSDIKIRFGRDFNATAKLEGDTQNVTPEDSNKYGGILSYINVNKIAYSIVVKSSKRYKPDLAKDKLYKLLEEDIHRVHNRVVEVLRARLDCWRLKPLSFHGQASSLSLFGLKTRYKFEEADQFTACEHNFTFQDLAQAYGTSNLSSFIKAEHLSELEEWLEENTSISVSSELIAQAKEARQDGNLRLAILNYITALEQVLNKCLTLTILNKLGAGTDSGAVKLFLSSNGTKFEDRINILLPTLIHESWLDGIDLKVITKAITVRNKVAHGETIKVIDQYHNIDWTAMFDSLDKFVDSLESYTMLLEADPETREISNAVLNKHTVSSKIWVHKMHKITCEITTFGDPFKDTAWIEGIVETISEIRRRQDSKFDENQHLTLNICSAPEKTFAKWYGGKVHFA